MKTSGNKEYLDGIVERVTYHNTDNGFCVLRIKAKGHKELVTIVGNIPSVSPGEYIQSSGTWYNDHNHGLQFKAIFLKSLPPNTLEGMEKYLGSGLIKGIGPHFAKKLVKGFGEEVFNVIENTPELLPTIEGIGKIRAETICKNWQDQKVIREIMVFLQSHGISTTKATRIYKTYGDESIEVVSENPYTLAKDIYGIGFSSADKIAANLGISKSSLIRARAGISYVLLQATNDGHCGLPIDLMIKDANKLDIEESVIQTAIEEEIRSESLTRDVLNNVETIFLTAYYIYEKYIANMLIKLHHHDTGLPNIDTHKAIPWVEKKLSITLADNQKIAVENALKNKITIITGGPGTGKTTIISSILYILKAKNVSIKLCAPTGRAAKRLSESTGLEAVTIHRLLDINPANGKFKYDENNQMNCNCLVLDEASMVDVPLFYALLKALPINAIFLIVGDVDQLPSVGAGQVLKDIIESHTLPTIKLTEVFRQDKASNIIKAAHLINQGQIPDLRHVDDKSDFYFINADPGEDLTDKIITLVKDRIPKKFQVHAINDIQVLSPMQRGGSGVRALNAKLQQVLNPSYTNGIEKYGQIFAIGDKIMQIENNYDKKVYNGDIGTIISINQEEQEVSINFYGQEVIYDFTDLDEITLAYVTTIHKSQGSEYPVVIIPLTMQSFTMLKRNLIYTAITRGKKLVIVIGQKKALALAVKKGDVLQRYSKLKEWLINQNPTKLECYTIE